MPEKFEQNADASQSKPKGRSALSVVAAGGCAILIAVGFASCASGPAPKLALSETGSLPDNTSVDAKDMDCGKLAGRMKIRIMQIRDYNQSKKASGVSQTLQGMVKSIFGGTSRGLNPDGQYAGDVEQLRNQNRQLAAKGCKTFDLEAELQPKAYDQTPTAR